MLMWFILYDTKHGLIFEPLEGTRAVTRHGNAKAL